MGRDSSRRASLTFFGFLQRLVQQLATSRCKGLPRGRRATTFALALASLVLAVAGPPVAFAQGSTQQFVNILEPGRRLSFIVEIGADGKTSSNFRVQAVADHDTKELQFLPVDLVSNRGVRVPRASLSVPLSGRLGAAPRDLAFTVTGLTVPGEYSGEIQVFEPGVAGYQAIPVRLNAIKVIPPALAQDSASLSLKLANSCAWFTRIVLGNAACRDKFVLGFSGLGRTQTAPTTSLTLVGGDGALVPAPSDNDPQPAVAYGDGKVTFTIPEGSLAPGHYTGRIRFSFDGGASIVDVPVAIDVRWPAVIAFVIIAFGVIVGRIQAFMTRTGDTIASSHAKLIALGARSVRLHAEYRDSVQGPFQRTFDDLDDQAMDQLAANLATVDQLVRLLEVVMALVPDPTAVTDVTVKQSIKDIEDAVKAGDVAGATAKLAELRTNLTAPGAAHALAPGLAKAGADQTVATSNWARFKTMAIVYGHAVLFVVAVIFIALAGLQTLYVTNGAQLGSAPLTDFLTLFAWGVASDVAGRTLTNFRG